MLRSAHHTHRMSSRHGARASRSMGAAADSLVAMLRDASQRNRACGAPVPCRAAMLLSMRLSFGEAVARSGSPLQPRNEPRRGAACDRVELLFVEPELLQLLDL